MRPLVASLIGGLLLAACVGSTPSAPPAPATRDERVPATDGAPTSAPGDTPEADPSPTPRLSLEATDPTTVRLGAGDPTLVEFFAFW
ncbi:MAG: hypothetical protein A2Z66_08695 [Chloroflexi bacterium RBG_13_66_10]|jgi:hypothetical protein|nr:MAG: hypothetical protein A2Z66_08695 [Chloroflexi bacterium RBG_13_66_10]